MVDVGGAAGGELPVLAPRGELEWIWSSRLVFDFFLTGSSLSTSWLSDRQAIYTVEHKAGDLLQRNNLAELYEFINDQIVLDIGLHVVLLLSCQ